MTILERVRGEIIEVLRDLNYINNEDIKFDVSFIPEANSKFGDVSTNVSLILAKQIGQTPMDVAEVIVKNLKEKSELVDRVEYAAPGFINVFLKKELLISELDRVSGLKYIETKFTDKRVLVEHSSPNLFKPFHIGHLMNNTIGESIVRMMKATHADLRTVSFPSDISIGIAKAIYVLKHKKNWSFFNEDIIKILGDAYVEGVKIYDEDESKKEEITAIARNLFERNEETEDWQLFEKSREINIEYFEKITKVLGSHFDHLIYESQAGVRGEQIVKDNLNKESSKEVFEIGEGGAIVFDTKRKKNNESDETIKSVFINSEGHPTYEAKDLGLLELKHEYYPFEYNFFVTDHEQTPHFDVVLQAARAMGGDWADMADRSEHIPHGRLNLKGGRMSSRLGNVLSVEDTLHLVNVKVFERLGNRVENLNIEEQNEIVKNISLSALKVTILKSKPGLNIDFDMETSLSFEGATGPYLLYTYARANSICEKSEIKNSNLDLNKINENHLTLIKKIVEFESLAKKSIEELAPQLVIKYLFELAQAFNTFYAKEKIITEDKELTSSNIALLEKFMRVFKMAMNMIGIEEVDRM